MEVYMTDHEYYYFSAGYPAIAYQYRLPHETLNKIRLLSSEVVQELRPNVLVVRKLV